MIAAEGWPLILLLLAVGGILFNLTGLYGALPAWLGAGALAWLYRDPNRHVPPLPLAVVSPVDGRVEYVKREHDPYVDRQAIHVRLKMNAMGIFGLRSPIEGKLLKQWLYRSGEGVEVPHLAYFGQSPAAYYYVLWIQSDEQDDVVLILEVAGRWQTPNCYIKPGERVGQGQRCGRTRSSTYVDLFMADNVRMEVGHDDHVLAGASVLATIIH